MISTEDAPAVLQKTTLPFTLAAPIVVHPTAAQALSPIRLSVPLVFVVVSLLKTIITAGQNPRWTRELSDVIDPLPMYPENTFWGNASAHTTITRQIVQQA